MKLRKMIVWLLLLSFCLSLLASCSRNQEKKGMILATCPGEYFRLYIPESWTSTVGLGISGGYMLSTLLSHVSLTGYPKENKSPEEFRAETEEKYSETYSVFSKIDESSREWNGQSITVSQYSFLFREKECRLYQTILEYSDSYYVFVFLCNASIFDDYIGQVQSILDNLEFSETPYEAKEKTVSGSAPEGMKLASSKKYSYFFYIPENWSLTNDSMSAGRCPDDGTNVSVMEYKPDDSMSVEEYIALCRKEYEGIFSDFQMESEARETELGGRKAYKITFSGRQDGVMYRFDQVFAVKGSKIYVLTYTAAEEQYPTHTEEWTAILRAFVFR